MIKKQNKLNLLTIGLVITLFLLTSFVSAEEIPATTDVPVGEITTEMTFEQFSKNPTPSNFGLMSVEDQSRFIAGINTFQNPNNEQIAVEYFVNPENVNENKETFVKFMEHKGVNLDIAEGKGVVDFSKDGTLKGANGEVITDIYKFSNSKIGIKVDKDGNVILIDNSNTAMAEGKNKHLGKGSNEWSFSGELDAEISPDGKTTLNIKEGTFDGKEVINGKFSLNDGIVQGTADSVAGITFNKNDDDLPAFEFNREENKLTTANANIEKIDPKTEIVIFGENIKLPNNDLIREGGLVYKNGRPVKVLTSSDVVVQGFNHITKFGNWYESELDLHYAENENTLEIDRNEEKELQNILEEGLGKGTGVTFSEMNKEIEEKNNEVFEIKKQYSEMGEKLTRLYELRVRETNIDKKNDISKQIDIYQKEIYRIDEDINEKKNELKKITDKYFPLINKKEEIKKRYKAKRQEIYDKEIIPKIKKAQLKDGEKIISNYFVYGNEKVWLGGQKFETKVEEENKIFPEFVKYNEHGITNIQEGKLEFHPAGGEMEIEKVSRDGHPLALFLDMNGEGKINNGKWEFIADGDEIKGKTLFEYARKGRGQGQNSLVSSDMRFQYSDSEGEKKTYDLDVDTKYYAHLNEEEELKLSNRNNDLDIRANLLKEQIKKIEQNPQVKDEFLKVKTELKKIREKLEGNGISERGLLGDYQYQEGQRERAVRTGNEKETERIEKEMKIIKQQISNLEKKKNEIIGSDVSGEYYKLDLELRNIKKAKDKNNEKLNSNMGVKKTGAFGQIVTSNNGDAKLSYQEYIEGHAVLKNDYTLQFTREVYKPEAGITVGGEILKSPIIYASNQDSLDLDILNGAQECIDTQFRLAYEYALATGKNIFYDNGRTCLRSNQFEGKEQKFIEGWMSSTGTKTYANGVGRETRKAGSWDRDIQIIPPTHYDKIQPGDVILLDGHAIGIKEVIEIPPGSGKIYFKKFAGSQPAISAHIYDRYVSIDELKRDKNKNPSKGGIISVYRWKFKGDEVTPLKPAETKLIPQLEPLSPPIITPNLEISDPDYSYDDDDFEYPDDGTPIIDDQPDFNLPDGKIEVDPQLGEFSEPGQTKIKDADLPAILEMPDMERKNLPDEPKDITSKQSKYKDFADYCDQNDCDLSDPQNEYTTYNNYLRELRDPSYALEDENSFEDINTQEQTTTIDQQQKVETTTPKQSPSQTVTGPYENIDFEVYNKQPSTQIAYSNAVFIDNDGDGSPDLVSFGRKSYSAVTKLDKSFYETNKDNIQLFEGEGVEYVKTEGNVRNGYTYQPDVLKSFCKSNTCKNHKYVYGAEGSGLSVESEGVTYKYDITKKKFVSSSGKEMAVPSSPTTDTGAANQEETASDQQQKVETTKAIEPKEIKPAKLQLPPLSEEESETMLNTGLVTPSLIDTNPLNKPEIPLEPYHPEEKEFTGKELFDNPRCPECIYSIDSVTGKFVAYQHSEVIMHEGEPYQLFKEFKLTKKQIGHLEKAKKEGKFD